MRTDLYMKLHTELGRLCPDVILGCMLGRLLDRFRSRTSTSKTTWKWRNQTTDFYFRFNLERQICLFASVFVFSSRLFISLDISISCQYIGKKKLSETGLVFPKIVSEQSWSFKGINSEYFVVLKRWTSSHFSEKKQKLQVVFRGKSYSY